MKKLLVMVITLGFLSNLAARAENYSLVIPKNTTLGRGEMVSMLSAIKTILNVYKKQYGTGINLSFMLDENAYDRTIESQRPDFIQASFLQSEKMVSKGYRAFVAVQAYGEINPKSCVFISKSSPVKDWKGLKNKNILIPKNNMGYFAFRKIVSQPLETFFKRVSFKKDDSSAIYALAFGQVDAVIVKQAMVKFFEFSNPGPVKKVRPLVCFQDGSWFTLAYHKRVPLLEVQRMNKFLGAISQNPHPDLEPIKVLLNRLQLKFVPVSQEGYLKTAQWYSQILQQGKIKKWDLELSRLKKLGKTQ